MSHTSYRQTLSIAPDQRCFVGGLIGKGGSKIRQTKEDSKVKNISWNLQKSQFEITGGVKACGRAFDQLTSQIAELMDKQIQYESRRYNRTLRYNTTFSPSPEMPVKQASVRNGFTALVASSGLTVEEESRKETERLAEKARLREERRLNALSQPKSLVGVNWGDLDSDEDDDDEPLNSGPRYSPTDTSSFDVWNSKKECRSHNVRTLEHTNDIGYMKKEDTDFIQYKKK